MASEAKEARILDAIITALSTIGPVGANWLTAPHTPVIGAPSDAMGLLDKPRIFVQHVSSVPATLNASLSSHAQHSTFAVVIAARDHRVVLNAKRDCLVALRAAEGTFTASFTQPIWDGEFSHNDSMMSSGIWLGVLQLSIDYETDHTDV